MTLPHIGLYHIEYVSSSFENNKGVNFDSSFLKRLMTYAGAQSQRNSQNKVNKCDERKKRDQTHKQP